MYVFGPPLSLSPFLPVSPSPLLLSFPLIRYRLLRLSDRILIAEVIVLYGFELVVEFVHERDPGRDVEVDDVAVGYVIEILYERSQ